MDDLDRQALASLLERPALRRLLEVFNDDAQETRIVGGAVRNALLGRPVTEVDCTTTLLPDAIVARAEAAGFKAVPTGIEHGTITVIVQGEPYEITTLREDVETNGRHAVVHFGRDFALDARRRDFTINALSLSLDGRLHDYTGGMADLAARRVRFIGDAHTRIREDYLRIMRFFRFHAEYAQGDPDPEGLVASGAERQGLEILSKERIRHELLKLVVARRAEDTIRLLAEHGFLTWLLDGAAEFGRLDRVAASDRDDPVPVWRLAALAVMVEEDAERLRERLRLSNDEHKKLAAYGRLLCLLKTWALPLDAAAIRRLAADHDLDTLRVVLAATAGEPRPIIEAEAREALARFWAGAEPVPIFPLRGADLIEGGVPKGPRIGQLLAQARQAWLAEGCRTDDSYSRDLLKRVLEQV
ncbi:CCA tRNA nucleotidyltransferase [Microvirga lotononidis]|uniref:tRNA nucleotidyltransferase/poly(A) polymerase n=1 Tax=Microvirga lotononidis TaxID=864069 RepID=I4YUK5_9HYPH|nr:CCA tRNA nucleotidyltransferase [Microvirga lotononidis]EIM27647.1 tRNA nucleotidyltransferase/poly(A) polymerase [Microvirga lotononidis]WQO28211.1 CCA tRNA nucleotidyltransferase [Microvirga lotononidis]